MSDVFSDVMDVITKLDKIDEYMCHYLSTETVDGRISALVYGLLDFAVRKKGFPELFSLFTLEQIISFFFFAFCHRHIFV